MENERTGVGDLLAAIVGGVVLTAVLLTGLMRAAEQADARGPVPGDIIAFAPGSPLGDDVDTRLAAAIAAPGRVACLLEAKDIATSGGSLIVEARDGPAYHVHWAGERSSGGSADCGRARDLLVTRADLEELALAAGGFGAVTKQPIPRMLTDPSRYLQ